MSKIQPSPASPTGLEAEAATHAVRYANADEHERASIMAWVEQSPAHAVAFARAEAVWEEAERLKALGNDFDALPRTATLDDDDADLHDLHAPAATAGGMSRRALIGSGMAAAAALAAAIPFTGLLHSGTERLTSARGEVRTVRLDDGSMVKINTGSTIEVAFSDTHRLVRLIDGEAIFDVAHDKERPFDVVAGDTLTRAVGTRFAVRRFADGAEVTVTEGIVEVSRDGGVPSRIAASHAATTRAGGVAASRLGGDAILRRTAWESGMLVFDGMTLAAAVDEFNRYRNAPITVQDKQIAGMTIGGRFGLQESDLFVDALEAGFPVSAVKRADGSIELVAQR